MQWMLDIFSDLVIWCKKSIFQRHFYAYFQVQSLLIPVVNVFSRPADELKKSFIFQVNIQIAIGGHF